MLDHIGFNVADFPASLAFYTAALAPLGITPQSQGDGWAMFGREPKGGLWIGAFGPALSHMHIAFTAETREQVRLFHAAALEAGGSDNGAPGLRPQYHPDYYAAFVLDVNGHNIEAVCRSSDGA